MAKVKELITVECRNVEEYYDLVRIYKRDGYDIKETDDYELIFYASKTRRA